MLFYDFYQIICTIKGDGVLFRLHHDANQGFRARSAHQNAAFPVERGLPCRHSFFQPFSSHDAVFLLVTAHGNIQQDLRITLALPCQFRGFHAGIAQKLKELQGGKLTVTGGAVLQEDGVSGLLTAQNITLFQHALQYVAVAYASDLNLHPVCLYKVVQTDIGHYSGNDGISGFSYGTLFLLDSFIMLLLGYLVYRFVNHHSTESGYFRNGPVRILSTMLVYGVVPVFGAYYVCTHSFGSWLLFLPAAAVGTLCLAGRDSDSVSGRRDHIMQLVWIALGLTAMTVYSFMRIFDLWHFLYLLSLPLFIWLLYGLWTGRIRVEGYGMILSAAVLLSALLCGAGYMIYLI